MSLTARLTAIAGGATLLLGACTGALPKTASPTLPAATASSAAVATAPSAPTTTVAPTTTTAATLPDNALAPTIPTSTVTGADANKWAAEWCQVQPSMTVAQTVGIMGWPTEASASTLSWIAYQWQYNAFFDSNSLVRQLDINDYRFTAAEKAAEGCATERKAS